MREEGAVAEMVNRRKSERWRSSQILAKLVSSRRKGSGTTEDISPLGFRLTADWDYPVGSFVAVRLSFPHGEEAEVEARVVWRKKKKTQAGPVQEIGFIVTTRKDASQYQELVKHAPKILIEDRRLIQRRKASAESAEERRQKDRRGGASLRARTDMTGSGLDEWITSYTYERVLQSGSAASIITRDQDKVMLGSNNYLGLTQHPKVKEAAIKAIEKYGVGAGGVRVLSGTMDLHRQLEERMAEFKKTEDCLVFPAGYMANFAALCAVLEKGDVALNDEINHASIVDGCRFSEATVRFYKHNDMAGLEKKLAQYGSDHPRLIITDGVFSMDGDVAPLKEIVALGKKYNAMVMVDDAHATGVIGATGRGSAEFWGVSGQVDITIATLSKAIGAIGGAVCGSRATIKTIAHRSRQFIFTSALPPAVCASAMAALEVIQSEPALIAQLHENRRFLWNGLKELGYRTYDTPSAVIPVIIGDEKKAYEFARRLDERGVFVNAVSAPAVPRELSRLRVSVMATHTQEQLGHALEAFRDAGRSLGLI
jgi:8-amino-7-oxononanoate synthase